MPAHYISTRNITLEQVWISTFPSSAIHTISANVRYPWLLSILQGSPIRLNIPVSLQAACPSNGCRFDSRSGHHQFFAPNENMEPLHFSLDDSVFAEQNSERPEPDAPYCPHDNASNELCTETVQSRLPRHFTLPQIFLLCFHPASLVWPAGDERTAFLCPLEFPVTRQYPQAASNILKPFVAWQCHSLPGF